MNGPAYLTIGLSVLASGMLAAQTSPKYANGEKKVVFIGAVPNAVAEAAQRFRYAA
jgi:hypothetical protein